MGSVPKAKGTGDVRQTLLDLLRRVSTLERTSGLENASIGEGGLTIEDGGNLTVRDGGDIEVLDGGQIISRDGGDWEWYDANGTLRAQIRTFDSPLDGQQLTNFIFYGPGGPGSNDCSFGSTYDTIDGTIRQGILIDDADNTDHLWVTSGGQGGLLRITPSMDDRLILNKDNGNAFIDLDVAGSNGSGIWGGTASDGSGLRELIRFVGGDNAAPREVRFRDGADSTYIDIRAASFQTGSSVETKDVLGDVEPDALSRVRSTPVRRWRYKSSGKDSPDPRTGKVSPDPETVAPERIGPLFEEALETCPGITGDCGGSDEPEDKVIDLAAAHWTLWQAVQEQAEVIDTLKAEVAALRGTVEANHGGTT